MKKCLYCDKEFEAKRESAKFCSVSHRVMWNRKNKGTGLTSRDKFLSDMRNILQEFSVTKEMMNDLVEKVSNFKIKTPVPKKANVEKPISDPKTLEELKAMCPSNLSGLDRSIWVEEKKAKFKL